MTGDDGAAADSDSPGSSNSKVVRLIREYELSGLGDELEAAWTRESDRMSLRSLADYFNEELLSRSLQENGTGVLDDEVSYYYEVLVGESGSSGERVEIENRLARQGVDVERLKSDFVSRQAMHTYLTKERDTSYQENESTDEERREARIETMGRLKNRVVAVAERSIRELQRSTGLSDTDVRVSVLVQVECTDCHSQYSFSEFVRNRGCDCHQSV